MSTKEQALLVLQTKEGNHVCVCVCADHLCNVINCQSDMFTDNVVEGGGATRATYLTSRSRPLKVVRGFLAPLYLTLVSALSLSSDLKLSSRKFT